LWHGGFVVCGVPGGTGKRVANQQPRTRVLEFRLLPGGALFHAPRREKSLRKKPFLGLPG
jgi:hypothetical protein